jgi:uncharacterized membrane protein
MEIIDMPTSGAPGQQRNPQDILNNGYRFSIGDAISEGFDIFKAKPGEFIAFTIVMFAISVVASFIPFASLVISGPLTAGFFIMAHHIRTGGDTSFGTFFNGFNYLGQLILLALISGILTVIGFVFLILPGIYLAVGYSLATLFVVLYRFEFWDSMEWSRKIVSKQWFQFFGFFIVIGFLNIAGLIALGVGILVTLPVSYCAIYAAFDQITNSSGGTEAKEPMPDTGAPLGGYSK